MNLAVYILVTDSNDSTYLLPCFAVAVIRNLLQVDQMAFAGEAGHEVRRHAALRKVDAQEFYGAESEEKQHLLEICSFTKLYWEILRFLKACWVYIFYLLIYNN